MDLELLGDITNKLSQNFIFYNSINLPVFHYFCSNLIEKTKNLATTSLQFFQNSNVIVAEKIMSQQPNLSFWSDRYL